MGQTSGWMCAVSSARADILVLDLFLIIAGSSELINAISTSVLAA